MKESMRERFEKMSLEDGVPSEGHHLFGPGSISEWLLEHDGDHLMDTRAYPESMLEYDKDKLLNFIEQEINIALAQEREAYQEELERLAVTLERKRGKWVVMNQDCILIEDVLNIIRSFKSE